MIYNLLTQHISESFQGLMQLSSSANLYTGTGTLISNINMSSITGSLYGTSSYSNMSNTASYLIGYTPVNIGTFATTGSNSFTGTESITGSLSLSGSAYFSDSIQIGRYAKQFSGALLAFTASSTLFFTDAVVDQHTAIFVNYSVVHNIVPTSQRAGQLIVTSNLYYGYPDIAILDVPTADIGGSTSDLTFSVAIGGGSANKILVNLASSGSTWDVYYQYTMI